MSQQPDWVEVASPAHILAHRKFQRVVLDPPDLNPGSWIGAGNVLVDEAAKTFWLTTRWKRKSERGFSWDSAVQILRSSDGEQFEVVTTLHRRDLEALFGDDVRGVEGQQLIRDPATGTYRLYLALHREGRGWDTGLLVADRPDGSWEPAGTVLPLGETYDALDARDAIISVLDGGYIALYKAATGKRLDGWRGAAGQEQAAREARVNMALATSEDGIAWTKHGLVTLDGKPQPQNILLSGNIVPGADGPLFVGMESRGIIGGITCGDTYVAYRIDRDRVNLEPVFAGPWKPLSPYERDDYPVHSYMDTVFDPFENRLLIYIEAIDPSRTVEIGIDTEVDRLLLYSVDL